MAEEESAKEHFTNAVVASLADNETETAIAEFEKALALGLPGETEVFARVSLGGEYARMALRKDLPIEGALQLPEWKRAESEITTGLRLDREGNYGAFLDRNGRSRLTRFDILCDLAASTKAKESPQAAIDYLEKMIAHCDHLPSSPLIFSLFSLGDLYHDTDNNQKAIECWNRVLAAEPVDYIDESGSEAKAHRLAKERIDHVQGTRADSSAKGAGKGCVVLVILISIPSFVVLAMSLLR
jgi:tetratricopeptide (TPR) repeat protein